MALFVGGVALILAAMGYITPGGAVVLGTVAIAIGSFVRGLRGLIPSGLALIIAGVLWNLEPPSSALVPVAIGGAIVALLALGSLGVIRTQRGGRHAGITRHAIVARDARRIRRGERRAPPAGPPYPYYPPTPPTVRPTRRPRRP